MKKKKGVIRSGSAVHPVPASNGQDPSIVLQKEPQNRSGFRCPFASRSLGGGLKRPTELSVLDVRRLDESLARNGPAIWSKTLNSVVVCGDESHNILQHNLARRSTLMDSSTGHKYPFININVVEARHPLKRLEDKGLLARYLEQLYPILSRAMEQYILEFATYNCDFSSDKIEQLYYESSSIAIFGVKPNAIPRMLNFNDFKRYCAGVERDEKSVTFINLRRRLQEAVSNYISYATDTFDENNMNQLPQFCLLRWLYLETDFPQGEEFLPCISTHLVNALFHGMNPTTAIFLSVMKRLFSAEYNDVLSTLWEEILQNKAVLTSFGELGENLAVLDNTINECLRLETPIPYLYKVVNQMDVIVQANTPTDSSCPCPVKLAPDTPIAISIQHDHLDQQEWGKDPQKFDPSRWTATQKIRARKFFPFGKGEDMCQGRAYALFWVKTLVVKFLTTFDFRVSHEEPKPAYENFTIIDRGIHIRHIKLKPKLICTAFSHRLIKFGFKEPAPRSFLPGWEAWNPETYTIADITGSGIVNIRDRKPSMFAYKDLIHPLPYEMKTSLHKSSLYFLCVVQLMLAVDCKEKEDDWCSRPTTVVQRQRMLPKQIIGRMGTRYGNHFFTTLDEDEGVGFGTTMVNRFLEHTKRIRFEFHSYKTKKALAFFDSKTHVKKIYRAAFQPVFQTVPKWFKKLSQRIDLDSLSHIAFDSIGQYFTRRIVPSDYDSDNAEILRKYGVRYICDVSLFGSLAVQPAFDRYGAKAYFDESKKLVAIHSSQFGRTVIHDTRIEDPEDWKRAMFQFRTSLLAQTTLSEQSRILWNRANPLMFASRENLSNEHPIRILLRPHLYRTAAVSWFHIQAILPTHGIARRTFGAFTDRSWKAALNLVEERSIHATFPELVMAKGLDATELGIMPLVNDGMDLWGLINVYVKEYVNCFYLTEKELTEDEEVRDFWKAMQQMGGNNFETRALSKGTLTELIADSIFWITAGSSLFASIKELTCIPSTSGRISGKHLAHFKKTGALETDVASFVDQNILIACLNEQPRPRLIGNWDHIFDFSKKALKIHQEFQANLKSFQQEIEERNKKRDVPFSAFDPKAFYACL